MSKIEEAKKEIIKLGFNYDDEEYENDLQLHPKQMTGGVIYNLASTRFKSFNKLLKFLNQKLANEGIKHSKEEYEFSLKESSKFESLFIVNDKEHEVINVSLVTKKKVKK